MSYFIFLKNSENVEGALTKIAENKYDLNNLTLNLSDYTVIEDTQQNFDSVRLGLKYVVFYTGNIITYENSIKTGYENLTKKSFSKDQLTNYINTFKNEIQPFLKNYPNSPLFTRWDNYYNQLSNLNLNSITYPLNETLEQYFQNNSQPSYCSFQIP